MKLQHRIAVRDEAHLRDVLAREGCDLDSFGKNGTKGIVGSCGEGGWSLRDHRTWPTGSKFGRAAAVCP